MPRKLQRARRVPGVPAPDRRFRRSKAQAGATDRRAWLHRTWRAIKAGVLLGGVAWAAVFLYTAVTASAWFSVQHVRVQGTQRLSSGEVTMLLDGLYGSNVVVTSLEPWRTRLLGSPWVKDASLRRVLPDAIDVVIDERRPVAIARVGRALQLVDADGVVIDDYGPRYASLDLPLLAGWTPGDTSPAAAAQTALASAALTNLAEAGLLGRVSTLDVTRPRDVIVTLNDDPTQLHLGDAAFATRVQSYLDMARRLQTMAADLEYVDLRFEDRVYIRPRRAGTTFTPVTDGRELAEGADAATPLEGDLGADVIPDDVTGQD